MSWLKTTLIGIPLFLLSWILGAYFSISSFPQKVFTEQYETRLKEAGTTWAFQHRNQLLDSDFRDVVRPAVDFLYSTALLDGQGGPHVLSLPEIDRYFVFQFMEDDTDVFDYVGSRNYGKNTKIEVLIVPQDYEGPTHDMSVVRMKTERVWVLGRYQLFDDADLVNVQAIQAQIRLTPLSEYLEGGAL